ncbi:premnaspirodiene oxygenase-like [Salvia miltiorrhiza]|uniref:premnaspirodiene oxygenase-like n=1 Tax=Salvia miltiorrhiza TaxID=226208 RepID=UPI0025AC7518|nr:premnaspirodiene oxygenase-like [Salvia miltiorrhiza]
MVGVEWTLTTTCAVVLPLVMLLLMKIWKKSENVGVDLPPGPKKLPIIGNLHLVSSGLDFRSFRDLSQQYGPIMHLKLGSRDIIVVSSPEIAKEILKDNDPVFAERPLNMLFWFNNSDIFFSPYGEYWRQMRKICTLELLSTKNVRSFCSIRNDEVSHLVDSIRVSAGEPVNLTEKIISFMSSIICRTAFGKVCKDKDSVPWLVKEAIGLSATSPVSDIFPSSKIAQALSWRTKLRFIRMRRQINVILDGIIDDHETNRKDSRRGNGVFDNKDLVDVLLGIKESGGMKFPINYVDIKGIILDMLHAGTDTSSSTVHWAMTELLRHPQVMAKAQAEIRKVVKEKGNTHSMEEEDIQKLNYLRLVIMETLRLHPPCTLIPRLSREKCKIGGYTIPAKSNVVVNAWAMHRDPKYWTDSESFKPERFANEASLDITGSDSRYLPFGSGKRICAGVTFGWVGVSFILAHLLHHFDWKLPHGVHAQDLNIPQTSAVAGPEKDLVVVATPHQSLPNE